MPAHSRMRGLGLGLGSGAIQKSWCLGSYLRKVESTQGRGGRTFAPGLLPSNDVDRGQTWLLVASDSARENKSSDRGSNPRATGLCPATGISHRFLLATAMCVTDCQWSRKFWRSGWIICNNTRLMRPLAHIQWALTRQQEKDKPLGPAGVYLQPQYCGEGPKDHPSQPGLRSRILSQEPSVILTLITVTYKWL